MTEQPFAQADPRWLALISEARTWFAGPLGQQMLAEERPLIEAELSRFFGGYLVQYGPVPDLIKARQIRHSISLGAPFRVWKSPAKSRPGLWESTAPTWWSCNMGWISVFHPMDCCVKRPEACGLAVTC